MAHLCTPAILELTHTTLLLSLYDISLEVRGCIWMVDRVDQVGQLLLAGGTYIYLDYSCRIRLGKRPQQPVGLRAEIVG